MTMCTRDVSRSIILPLPSSPHCRPTTATTAIVSSPFSDKQMTFLSRREREQPLGFHAMVEPRNRRIYIIDDIGKGEAFGSADHHIMQHRLIIRERGEAHR